MKNVQSAAESLRLRLHVLHASSEAEIDAVFATSMQIGAGALAIGPDPFFNARTEQLAALALHHGIPAVYQFREFAAAGGLMSYGTDSLKEAYHLNAVYIGPILRGEKPGDLPVQQATKGELVINLKTAKALGLGPSVWCTAVLPVTAPPPADPEVARRDGAHKQDVAQGALNRESSAPVSPVHSPFTTRPGCLPWRSGAFLLVLA